MSQDRLANKPVEVAICPHSLDRHGLGYRGSPIRVDSSGAWWRIAIVMFAVAYGANQFVPMLLVYRRTLHLSEAELLAMFGVYTLGLAPAFILSAPAAARYGQRTLLLFCALASIASSIFLIAGPWVPGMLYLGRFAAGIASGGVFAVGTSWLRELSEETGGGKAARRAAISLTAGFGMGPLVAGALGRWAPAPDLVPYAVHIALGTVALVLAWPVATSKRLDRSLPWNVVLKLPGRSRQWMLTSVVPVAPWVFGFASVAFVLVPTRAPGLLGGGPLAAGVLTAAALGIGAIVQTAAKSLRLESNRASLAGLALGAIGFGFAAAAGAGRSEAFPLMAIGLLGSGYGLALLGGLGTIATSGDLDSANHVALFYVIAYGGAWAPFVLNELAGRVGYGASFASAACLVALTAVLVGLGQRRRSLITSTTH